MDQSAPQLTESDPGVGSPQLTGNDSVDLAAPQISEEAMIRNALDISYQLYHAEDYRAAAQSTSQILEKYPKRKLYWVRYLRALSLEHDGLLDLAIADYKKVRKDAPRSTYSNAATFRQGLCEMKMGLPTEAVFTFRDVIETHPRSEYRLQAYIHLGNLYRTQSNWKAATRIYKDVIRLYPDTSWAHTAMLYLAESYAYEGRYDRAIYVYQSLQQSKSAPVVFKAQAQLRIGEIHMKEKQWQDAISSFRMALRDYSEIPGLALTAEEKIALAQEGRRAGNVPYKTKSRGPSVQSGAPEDSAYRLKQEQEAIPY